MNVINDKGDMGNLDPSKLVFGSWIGYSDPRPPVVSATWIQVMGQVIAFMVVWVFIYANLHVLSEAKPRVITKVHSKFSIISGFSYLG